MVNFEPGDPFDPLTYSLQPGTHLYRVYSNQRTSPVEFNPGVGSPTRFAFFGIPLVSVLYAAETEQAAICETILHDVPPGSGYVMFDDIKNKVCAQITPSRVLKLASLMGDGLRKLGTEAKHVTGTMSSEYQRTVKWAQAAHTAGFDGLVWMSNRRNTDRAYVFFGDKVIDGDLDIVPVHGNIYAAGPGFERIVDYLSSVDVEILMA
ncbi:RES family NAD+ phosphorylase [Glutamicibacter ectropisis]|uniref:RES family NAD+ phosphorylase n=1 Tax=Glutamicibacter ectropisis TaxID=3046593 RepID=A0AAU6WDI9_9MICC